MALGLARTALIVRFSFWSASKKCSAAFGPRFTTGACLPFISHHDIAVATGLMLLGFRGVALCRIEFGALNLGGESLSRHR